MLRYFFAILGILFAGISTYAQLIVADPGIPIDTKAVTITFDATQGDKGLMNYSGDDVYAHTGVITDSSKSGSDWRYVKAAWNVNLAACKLTKISTNQYQITFSPSIRESYGVPVPEKILKMAFVFRNSTGSKTGRDVGGADIFVPVYEQGLNIAFSKPSDVFNIVSDSEEIPVEAAFTGADSAWILLDGTRLVSSVTSPLSTSVTASGTQRHMLVARAWKGTDMAADTVYYLVRGTTQTEPRPSGVTDGINYIDNQTVTFVLYAPYKDHIYLIGGFNNWMPDNDYLLKKDGDYFWYTLTNLTPQKEYLFQYLIDDTLRIADPYCDKISDPSNDKYIPDRIYPDLIQYPEGKTTEIAGAIQTAQEPYNWQDTSFTPPAKDTLVIYELLIRDFTDNQDIKTITDTLGYLKQLGVNTIELMPFNEFEGNDSWGYNPSFYFAPDKAYGTKNDYKKFIDECHKKGIAVIMDMVLNHSYGSSPMVRMYFANGKPTAQNPWYNITSPNPTYAWGYDFNHESTATQKFVDRVTSYWIKEYKIDGYRFDFTKGFTNTVGDGWAYDASRIAILERMTDAIRSVKPDAEIIFEHFTANSEEKELSDYGIMIWGNLNSAYNEATMGYNTSGKSDFSGISYLTLGWSEPDLVGYMESHDEERLMYKNITYGNQSGSYDIKYVPNAVKRMELASAFFYTVPGPKMIWKFGELGYDLSIEYNGRLGDKPALWSYYDNINRKRLYNITSKLIQLKKTEPVFSTSDFTMDVSGAIKTIHLSGSGNNVVIAGNFDVISTDYTLTFPVSGTWYEFFTADSVSLTGTTLPITLAPGEYRMYSTKKMTGYGSINVGTHPVPFTGSYTITPNPASSTVRITAPQSIERLTLVNINGFPVLNQSIYGQNVQLDISQLPDGVYSLLITDVHGKSIAKKLVIMK